MRLLSLCVVAGLVMLAAARAHADWRTDVAMTERPNDVLEVWGPGHFSVGHPVGAYLFMDGGVALELRGDSTFEPAGLHYQPAQDCFVSVSKDFGVLVGARPNGSICGNFDQGSNLVSPGNLVRVKHAADGGAVAVASDWTGLSYYVSGASLYDPSTFQLVGASMLSPHSPVGVVRVGSKVHVLIGSLLSPSTIVYWVDSSNLSRAESQLVSTSGAGLVQSIDMFSAGSPARPYAVVGTQYGLLQGSTQTSPDPLRQVVTLDGGVSSVSMNVGFGADAGQGFGMAIVEQPDGGRQVLSPVPMLSDTQAGTVWRPRPLPDSIAAAPLKQVACAGASYCVLTAHQANGGNVFIYTNGAGPQLSVSAPGAAVVDTGTDTSVTLAEDRAYQLTFTAQDPDGDPVLVMAPPPGGSTGGWTVVPAAGNQPGDPVVWDVTTAATCESKPLGSISVSASDGLARHEAYENVQVQVKHTRAPEPPAVVLSDGGVPGSGAGSELIPGGAPVMLRMVGNGTTAAGCVLHPRWEPLFSGTGVPSLEQDGGTAVVTPPDRFCSPTAGSFAFRLRVTDDGGLSNSSDFNVRVAPWGRPNEVFGSGTDAGVLTAGQPGFIEPTQPVHVCQDGNASFPGVDTDWRVTLPGGGDPRDVGITVRAPDGGSPDGEGVVRAEKLVVEAPDCEDRELVVSATHFLRAAAPIAGPESQRSVRVRTVLTPFAEGVLQLGLDASPSPSDAPRVNARSTLNCPASRGLKADLWLEPLGGGERIASKEVFIPDTWELPRVAGCGRPLLLKAAMEDNEGHRSAELVRQIDTPWVETGLEALSEVPPLLARCGEQARVTLTQTFPPGACQTPDVTWTQERGPPLEQTSLSGRTVSLVTRDTGLDSLVGESLVMRVTASAGPDNEASQPVTVPITVEPFVKVRRRTEVPAASETGLVGVSVDLHNTTACGVSGVSYVERLEGLTYVEGSAKFDGQPVAATWEAGALTVTGLTLAGEGTGTLTYVARPHLVGERRMEGEARLRNELISLSDSPGPQVPDSGCGCSGSGPGPVLFALGALVAAMRRRRR